MAPSADLQCTIRLMAGRHTRDMHGRHVVALRKICALNKYGFFLHDIEYVKALICLTAAHVEAGVAEYEPVLCELLSTLAVPFQKKHANDDARHATLA